MIDIATLNDREAVAFLRACIHQPPEVVEDSPLSSDGELAIDPGWCATEHAVVAQLALDALGIPTHRWSGAVMYFDRQCPKLSFQMLDHEFLALGEDREDDVSVFDSAASFPGVEGLPFSFVSSPTGLQAAIIIGQVPDEELLAEIHADNTGPKLAVYGAFECHELSTDRPSFTMESPLGLWLEERYGDQEQMWANLIAVTSRIFEDRKPHIPVPISRDHQEALWDWVALQ